MKRLKNTQRLTGQVFTYFGASVVQGVLSLALLPLATRILGAEEFGVYVLLMAVAGLLAAISEFGSGIVLNGHYLRCDEGEKKRLLASIGALSFCAAVVLALALLTLWPLLSAWIGEETVLSHTELILVAASIPLRMVIVMATQVLVIQSRATALGLVVVAQSIGMFAVTLAALYLLSLGQMSLFLGNLAGLAFGAGCALYVLRKDYRALPSGIWIRRLFSAAPSSVASGILDNARSALEAATLTRVIGTAGLAIYSHARLYSSYLFQVTNAFGYALWAKSLNEAHDEGGFVAIGKVWNGVYLILTAAGIAFIAIGYELVFLLTHGKFVAAAFWAPFWISYILIQNSGKAVTAVLYAAQRGTLVARLRVITTLCALVGIVFAIPAFGIAGGVAVAFGEMLAFRALLQLFARRMRALPFQDFWAFAGAGLIMALALGLDGQDFAVRLLTCIIAIGILLLLRKEIVLEITAHLRAHFFGKKPDPL